MWREGNALLCRVTDDGPGLPPLQPLTRPDPGSAGGRGMWLVTKFADRIEIARNGHGGDVTVEVYLP